MTGQLIRNTGTYILTGFVGQGLVFFLWIILARWLTPEQIGLYALCLFIIEFFSVLAMFGLDAAITRFYYAGETLISVFNNALAIFSFSNLFILFSLIITLPFIAILIPTISPLLKQELFLIGSVIIANTIANFSLVHYSALRKASTYALLQFFKTLLFCGLSLLFVRSGFGIPGILYAFLISSSLVAIFFFTRESALISVKILDPRLLKNIVFYGFPLFLYSASNVIVTYFSRLLLDRYTDLAIMGVYSFFLSLTLQLNGLWGSFNRAWTPELFAGFSIDKKNATDQITFMIYAVCFLYLAALGLFLLAGRLFLFEYLFKGFYLSNINLFYILLLTPLFTGIYTVTYPLYYYENKTMRIFYLSFGLSLLNIGLTFFLVKYYGETGAALGYFFISFFTVLIYLLTFRKLMAIPNEIFHWSIILSLLMSLSVFVVLIFDSFYLFVVIISCGVLLSYQKGRLSQKHTILLHFIRTLRDRIRPAEN